MKVNRLELMQALKFLIPAIGKNEARKNMMYLHVESKNGKCILTAADGYIIKHVKLFIDTLEPCEDGSFLIPGSLLPKFKTELNRHNAVQLAEITGTELKVNDHGTSYPVSDWSYPNLNQYFELEYSAIPEFKSAVAYNSELMIKLLTGFPDEVKGQKGSTIKLTAGTVKSIKAHSFRYQTQDQKYTAIIMPVKISW